MRLIFKKTILLTAFICILIGQAHATKRYWIASATANWNSTANWSTSSGGASGASVPSSLTIDTAYFDGNGLGNCNINTNVTVDRLEIKSTYTDTIFQNAYTITVGYRYMILDGGVFMGSSSSILVYGHYNNSGCKFKSTSGTLEVRGDFKLTGTGSFTHNSGTVKFSYDSNFSSTTATNTTSSATKELYALTLETSGSTNVRILTITSGNTLTVNSTLTISGDGENRIMTGTIEAKGDISVTNTKSGATTGTGTGTILIDGSGAQHLSGTSSNSVGHLPKITVTKSSSDSLFLSNYINLKNDFTYNSGRIIYGTSKVILSATLTMTGSVELGEVWIYPIGGHTTITVASGTTVTVNDTLCYNTVSTSYIVTVNTGTIAAKGDIVLSNISNTGANGGGNATILINGTVNQTITGPTALYTSYLPNVTINKSDTLFLKNYINAVGNWTYTAGTISAGTSTLIPYGNFTISGSHKLYNVTFPGFNNYTHTLASGTTLTTTGKLSFAGTAIITVNGGTLEAQGDITNSNTSGGGSTSTTNILINGTGSQTFKGPGALATSYLPKITINKSTGTLHLRSTINIIGDWIRTAGSTIDADSSTIVFYGSHTISGKNTLKNVTFPGAASYTHTIPSGDTLTATGTLAFAGSSAITVNTGVLQAQGDINISNTSASSGTGSSVIQINGTASQTITGSGVIGTGHLPKIVINKSGGTLSLSSFISSTNDWTYTAGTIVPGTSTVAFYGSHTISGSHTLKNITFPGSAAYTHTIASGTTLTATGTVKFQGSNGITLNTGTLEAQGDITAVNTSTVTTSGTSTILIDGSSNQKFTGQATNGKGYLPKISVNKTGGTLSMDSTLSLINDWTYTAGTVDASTYNSKVYFYGTHNASCQGTSTTMSFHDVFFAGTTSLTGNFKAAHDLTINTGNTLTQGNYDLNVGRNWTHNGTWTVGTGTNTFDGTYLGTITRASSATETFPKLVINKSSNRVEYNVSLIVSTSLNLSKGAFKSANDSLFTINSGVTVTGGSDSSYIHGRVKKIGNTAFTFPLGNTLYSSGNYRPVKISAPSNSTDAFLAKYFDYGQTLSTKVADSLYKLSYCEYWTLSRTAGSSNVNLSLFWNSYSCNINSDSSKMRVSKYNTSTSTWDNLGRSASTSNSVTSSSTSSGGTYTYAQHSACIAMLLHPGSNALKCLGDTVTLGGSPTASGGQTPYAYSWRPIAELDPSNISNPRILVRSAATYTLTVTDSLGCTRIDSIAITTPTNPGVSVGRDTVLCYQASLTINALPNTLSYTWTPSTDLSCTTCISPVTTPHDPITYTVTYTDSHSCKWSDDISIGISPVPNVDISGDHILCGGSSSQLDVNVSEGAAPFMFKWHPVSGLSDTTIYNPVATPTVQTTYTLTLKDQNNCSDTASFNVNVLTSLTVDAGSNISICPNEVFTLNASGADHFNWYDTEGLNNPQSAFSTGRYSLVDTTFMLYVTGSSGDCEGTDSVQITLKSLPSLSVTPTTSYFCHGGTVGFSASGSGSFSWYKDTSLAVLSTSSSISESPTGSTSYQVVLTGSNSCKSTQTVLANLDTISLIVPNDTVQLFEGQSARLNIVSDASNFSWSPSTGLNDSTSKSPVTSAIDSVDYTLTATSDQAVCSYTTTVHVFVIKKDDVRFTYSYPGLSVQFNAPAALSGTYAWDFGDGGTSTSKNPTHTYSSAGQYQVKFTYANSSDAIDYYDDVIVR